MKNPVPIVLTNPYQTHQAYRAYPDHPLPRHNYKSVILRRNMTHVAHQTASLRTAKECRLQLIEYQLITTLLIK